MEIESIRHKGLRRFFETGNAKGLVGDAGQLRKMLAFYRRCGKPRRTVDATQLWSAWADRWPEGKLVDVGYEKLADDLRFEWRRRAN